MEGESKIQYSHVGVVQSRRDENSYVNIMPDITISEAEGRDPGHKSSDLYESEDEFQGHSGGEGKRRGSFRKRKKSFHNVAGGSGHDAPYVPPYKFRRHHHFRRQVSGQGKPNGDGKGNPDNRPRKFLLGGNERDPLNLNSLGGSDNAVTPKTSPMPIPAHRVGEIPILIPRNPVDPLGLNKDDIEKYTDVIVGVRTATASNGNRKKRRRKSTRKRTESECSVDTLPDTDGNESENIIESGAGESRSKQPKVEPADRVTTTTLQPDSASIQGNKTEEVPVTRAQEEDKVKVEEESMPSSSTEPVGEAEKEPSAAYPFRVSSEYVPLSSYHLPSPFVLDTMNENFTVLPFESPSMTNYSCSQEGCTVQEPFSPPPNGRLCPQRRVPSGHYGNYGWSPNPNASHVERRSVPVPLNQQVHGMNHRRRHRYKLDPIVSPVIRQFGHGLRGPKHRHHHKKHPGGAGPAKPGTDASKPKPGSSPEKGPKNYRPKDKIFQYGNYNQYYGYRNGSAEAEDARLRVFKKEWFEGKDALDIGCNIGHVTLSVARDFKPRRIVGIDIDNYLIKIAQKNIKYYVDRDPNDGNVKFPHSLSIVHGALQPLSHAESVALTPDPRINPEKERKVIPFPFNVNFRQENYVMETDDLLEDVKPQYDIILCLSITKWIHLNFGDDGLKRFFRRGFLNLRPGGILIIEPQSWSSYKRKKKLTEQIFQTFQTIKFRPDQFKQFLLDEVGYTSVEMLGVPAHNSKGFQRPVFMFKKGLDGKLPPPSATITTDPSAPDKGKTADAANMTEPPASSGIEEEM